VNRTKLKEVIEGIGVFTLWLFAIVVTGFIIRTIFHIPLYSLAFRYSCYWVYDSHNTSYSSLVKRVNILNIFRIHVFNHN